MPTAWASVRAMLPRKRPNDAYKAPQPSITSRSIGRLGPHLKEKSIVPASIAKTICTPLRIIRPIHLPRMSSPRVIGVEARRLSNPSFRSCINVLALEVKSTSSRDVS